MIERYNRQSFLGLQSERTLGNCVAGLVGLGGGGSHISQQLAHLGVRDFRLFDRDVVEESNLNRLIGATFEDVGKQKTYVAARLIRGINPCANIEKVDGNWQQHHAILRGCDVIFGAVDTYRDRHELEITARRYMIPYVDIGMDVHQADGAVSISGQVILSMPGELCMHCLGFLRDELLVKEAEDYGAAGPRPQVVWANGVLASLAVGVFTQLFTPWHKAHVSTVYMEYDGNSQTIMESNRLKYVKHKQCPHFGDFRELGDPFWIPEKF